MFFIYIVHWAVSSMIATRHMWLLGIWNVISVAKELNFKFYLIKKFK